MDIPTQCIGAAASSRERAGVSRRSVGEAPAELSAESATEGLQRSLQLMQATLDSAADGILVTDEAGGVVAFNARFLRIWDLPAEQVRSMSHAALAEQVSRLVVDPAQLRARIEEIDAGRQEEVSDVLSLVDGRTFERVSRMLDRDSPSSGRVWSYCDVTTRRQAEDALRDEARMLDLLNQTGSALAATLDLHVLLQRVTDAATALSGAQFGAFFYNTMDDHGEAYALYTLSGAPREAFEHFGHPRATPVFAPTFKGEGTVRSDDVVADPRYGHWAPHHGMPAGHLPVRSYLAVPVRLGTGEVAGGLFFGHAEPGLFTDRTQRLVEGVAAHAAVALDNARLYEDMKRTALERERLVEAERAARAEVERVSGLKDHFLATLSHELRTPLSAILGWSKVLMRTKGSSEHLEKGLDAITRNADAQAKLIEDLLDMNRIVSGKLRLDVQPIDLAQVIHAAFDVVAPSAESKALSMHRTLDFSAGAVHGDAHRLQQVVWNLLANAVKFTPRGGRIDVVLERVDSHIEIRVTDSGIGIEPELLTEVFDRFRQADSSTTREHGGLGLGLSIARQLVELHGGSVHAESEGLGRGATFIVRLPVAAVRRESGREHPAPPAGDASVAYDLIMLDGVKVLVVDDEPDARELVAQILAECRADVTAAANAADALRLVSVVRPDVLISDIGMPGCDGYQLLQQVRRLPLEHGGRTPAIALTAFARSEDRAMAMRAGYQVHVAKPVDPHELMVTVASLAGRVEQ